MVVSSEAVPCASLLDTQRANAVKTMTTNRGRLALTAILTKRAADLFNPLSLFARPDFGDDAVGEGDVLIGADGVAPFEWEERGAWTSGIRFGGAPKQEAQRE